MNLEKFFTTFFIKHLRWLLLKKTRPWKYMPMRSYFILSLLESELHRTVILQIISEWLLLICHHRSLMRFSQCQRFNWPLKALNENVEHMTLTHFQLIKSKNILSMFIHLIHILQKYIWKSKWTGKKTGLAVQIPPGRSSHQRCSMKKRVLKNFAKLTGKQLCPVSFLIKFQASGLQVY